MNEDTPKYDIKIRVRTQYIPSQSDPENSHYVFAYHITIANRGLKAAKLLSRRWLITDSDHKQQEVTGDGVVGQQPTIEPGRSYEYSSGCVLETEVGTMEGHYIMKAVDGQEFIAPIPRFVLSTPRILH